MKLANYHNLLLVHGVAPQLLYVLFARCMIKHKNIHIFISYPVTNNANMAVVQFLSLASLLCANIETKNAGRLKVRKQADDEQIYKCFHMLAITNMEAMYKIYSIT
jgi:uncharacterized membrane protein YobD (UPF0266 family)